MSDASKAIVIPPDAPAEAELDKEFERDTDDPDDTGRIFYGVYVPDPFGRSPEGGV